MKNIHIKKVKNNNYPIDYQKKEVTILNIKFFLKEPILIPRIETEILLNTLIKVITNKNLEKIYPQLKLSNKFRRFFNLRTSILDVGCGCGFIGLVLKKYLKINKAYLLDNNPSALKLAKKNQKLNKISNCRYYLNNLLIKKLNIKEDFVIIANLPYIPFKDFKFRFLNKIEYEDKNAIYSGLNGDYLSIKLLQQISNLELKPKLIILELDPRNIKLIKNTAYYYLKDVFNFYKIILDHNNLERFLFIY